MLLENRYAITVNTNRPGAYEQRRQNAEDSEDTKYKHAAIQVLCFRNDFRGGRCLFRVPGQLLRYFVSQDQTCLLWK